MADIQVTVIILLVFKLIRIDSQGFESYDINFVTLVQKEFCGSETLCSFEINDGQFETTRSLDDLPLSPKIIPGCCQNCSCDLDTCRDFGTCCPDILERLPPLDEALQPNRIVCKSTSLKSVGDFYTYWIYSLCDNDYKVRTDTKSLEVISKCENRESYFDFDTRQPVVDNITQKTYANRYCALCSFAQDINLVPWYSRIRCYHDSSFFKPVNIKTLVSDVLQTVNCDLEFTWPSDVVDFNDPLCREVEVGCNNTGKWIKYDPLIEAACYTYRAPYDYKYNNIFCYLCNEVEYRDVECLDTTGRGFAAVSFAAVLDFNQVVEDETNIPSECPQNHVLDKFKGICREVSCIFPRFLQGGKCVNQANNLTEVAYRLQLKFTPSSQEVASELSNVVTVIETYVKSLLADWDVFDATADSGFYYTLSFVVVETESTYNETNTSPIPKRRRREGVYYDEELFEATVPTFTNNEANTPPNTVDLPDEQRALLVINYIVWQVRWYFRYTYVDPVPTHFIDNVLGINNINVTLNSSFTGNLYDFSVSVTEFDIAEDGSLLDSDIGAMLVRYPSFIYLPFSYLLTPIYADVQPIKHTMICPLVRIDHDEYNITETIAGIYVEELNVTFLKSYITTEGNMSNGSYLICSDSYLTVTDKYTQSGIIVHEEELNVSVQGVLSIVCSCTSILCSILTLTTYCLFADYRTQPGINNMCLCVYLIFAQALFTFATAQADLVSDDICSIFGALAHFFWLMVIFSMNVCCFHMVTVFRGQLENRTKTAPNCIRTLLYNAYCTLGSFLFVAINITVSVIDRDVVGVGYKNDLCYISKPAMIGYVFAIPLGFVLFANIISFVFVVLKIRGASNVSISSNKNRNLFKIYAKLSSLTGLTWILGFLYVFTKMEFFEYCFIILNGGIGFFIFLSFVCNRRTFEKYKSTFCRGVEKEGDTTGVSTISKETEVDGHVKT